MMNMVYQFIPVADDCIDAVEVHNEGSCDMYRTEVCRGEVKRCGLIVYNGKLRSYECEMMV